MKKYFIFAALFSFFSTLAMHFADQYSVNFLCLLLLILFTVLIASYYHNYIQTLTTYFIFISSLPFIHLIFYFNFDFSQSYEVLWGLAANQFMADEYFISKLLVISNVWLSSCVLACLLQKKIKLQIKKQDFITEYRGNVYFVAAIFLLFLAWSAAPSLTLFEGSYMSSLSNLEINYSSGWAFSYFLLIVLFVSSYQIYSSRTYIMITYFLLFIIGIYFGLLRGDRESLTLFISILIYRFLFLNSLKAGRFIKPGGTLIISLVFIVFFVNGFIGGIRSSIISGESLTIYSNLFSSNLTDYMHGTWSAVLLTPLSVLYAQEVLKVGLLYGADYLDLLLSIPPGFISDLIGYERPWSSDSGPAVEMRYGLGGTHVTVLPLRNFGIMGVIFFAYLLSSCIYFLEKLTIKRLNLYLISVYVSMFMIIPHWVWYGEKYIINHVIYGILIYFLIKIFYEKDNNNSRHSNNT